MGDTYGPGDDAILKLIGVLIFIGTYIIIGLTAGIILAVRSRRLDAGSSPTWWKVARSGWILAGAGCIAKILQISLSTIWVMDRPGPGMMIDFRPLSSFMRFLCGATSRCPGIWILAWFKAKRPDVSIAKTIPQPPHQESVWPPAPTRDSEEHKPANGQ